MGKSVICLAAMAFVSAFVPAAAAEEQTDEMTVYGTNRSEISASPLTDTRAIESSTKIEKTEIEPGLTADETQVEREITPVEKPRMDDAKRDKPDVTPEQQYRVDWKLTLLIGLLEAAQGK